MNQDLMHKIREHVLKCLHHELGTVEQPKNSNVCKYNDWYYDEQSGIWLHKKYHELKRAGNYARMNSMFPWCGTFVAYVLHFALKDFGRSLPKGLHDCIGYVPAAQNWLEANNCLIPLEEMQPCDILMFDWQKDKFEDHIGFGVELRNPKVFTIEGNTASDDKGNQSNGGGVFDKLRKPGHIAYVASLEKILNAA